MPTLTLTNNPTINIYKDGVAARRIESIDLLRGIVMIIMALDHVRHFFHQQAYFYEPTDLGHTSVSLFFTRWITHFCAPVFVFLAGVSAYLYGVRKTKKEVSQYLFSRGLWLIFVELFIIGLGQTFNPTYPYFNLQVIWAIGISMIALSAM
ncbi:MAG TPA: heparan-alpha-glucosaminide N-acetyltransferase domain-containing protein, partial [Puia sp.]|nr:heparan-alpha-glucosaminide N-acetyltransferase domain-containing protein [Puia sp.]